MRVYLSVVVKKAWSLFRGRIADKGHGVPAFMVQTALLFALLYFVPWFGDFRSESRLALAGAAAVLGSVLLSFLGDLLRAPAIMWREMTAHVEGLERSLTAKFSVPHLVGRKPERVAYGNTLRSPFTGSQQVVVREFHEVICVPVTNETSATLKNCEAYLARFQEVDAETPYWESMRLQWVPVAEERSTVDIPAHGSRSLILFKVTGERVHLVSDAAPVKMVTLIKDKAEYEGLVVLTCEGSASTFVAFTLHCNAPDEQPSLSIMRRRISDEDEDLGWAFEQPLL